MARPSHADAQAIAYDRALTKATPTPDVDYRTYAMHARINLRATWNVAAHSEERAYIALRRLPLGVTRTPNGWAYIES